MHVTGTTIGWKMTTYLRNFLAGEWQPESTPVHRLLDPLPGGECTGGQIRLPARTAGPRRG